MKKLYKTKLKRKYLLFEITYWNP